MVAIGRQVSPACPSLAASPTSRPHRAVALLNSMDDLRQSAPAEARRETSSALPFAEQREQIRRFLGELTESTASAEAEIAGVVKRLLDDTAAHRGGASNKEHVAREAQLNARSAQLAELQKQLEERRTEIEQLLKSAGSRGTEAVEAEQRAQAALQEVAAKERQIAGEQDEVARLRQKLEDKLRRHEAQEEELEAEQSRSKVQRRRIAAELREQREAARREHDLRDEELQGRREELERRERQLQARAAELERQATELAEVLVSRSDDSEHREEVVRLQQAFAERSTALVAAEASVGELRAELQAAQDRLNVAERQFAELDAMQRRLDAAETEAGELRELLEDARTRAAESSDLQETAADFADLQRAFAIAQEDLRDLRQRNAVLERTQAAASAAGPSSHSGDTLPMDWESQKRRLLASLESDFDAANAAQRSERLTIEGTIQITDSIVADREREIAELKRVLEEQRCNVGEVTVGAAALHAALDDDELIREHRTQIEDLKRQWEEKLRSAEIEVSIERAKLAREKAELAERQADLEAKLAEAGLNPKPGIVETADAKKSGGGRWLARLGLRDGDNG